MINIFRPYVTREMREAVEEVLHSDFVGQGPKVDQFEKDFAKKFCIFNNVISVNSGTAALETAYDLAGLKEGDEVISTPLTCTATNIPLIRRGVKIVWADILEDTLCIDPNDVYKKITERTKAIVQVHLGGIEAKVPQNRFERTIKIPIISDAAQALGIFTGDYTCCSFQAIKHITTGDGGIVIVKGEELAHKAKLLRWFGIDREKKIANNWQAYKNRAMTFNIELPGTKRHMNDIAAAMGIEALKVYDHIIEHRKKIFEIYKTNLREVPGLKLIDGPNNTYWLATLLVENRDGFAQKLYEADIDTHVVQIRNDNYSIFGGVNERPNPKNPKLPIMDKVEFKYISIPVGMNVTEDDAYYIVNVIKRGW